MSEARQYSVTWRNLCSGKVNRLTSRGGVCFLCNDGSGRSRNAAEIISSQYEIPGIYFNQGLKHISDPRYEKSLPYIYYELNKLLYLSVILTPEEVRMFQPVLFHLSCYIYADSCTAAVKMAEIVSSKLPRFRF